MEFFHHFISVWYKIFNFDEFKVNYGIKIQYMQLTETNCIIALILNNLDAVIEGFEYFDLREFIQPLTTIQIE